VAAVLIGILGIQVIEQRRQLNEALEAMEQIGIQEAALAAVNSPDARLHELRSADGRLQVKTVLLPGGQGYLIDNNLPQLPEDHTYQLWQVADGVKISVGVLGREPEVVPFQVASDVSALAITAEQAPGVVSSSRSPVVIGTT
jgi:hypothetical protein